MDLLNISFQGSNFDNTMQNLINNCYNEYLEKKPKFDKMHEYYKSETDATENYKEVESRSNSTINFDFMSKFIDEEVSYSVGNDVNYLSYSEDKNIVDFIRTNLAHWSKKHEHKLCKTMLQYGIAYELCYFDKALDGSIQFSSKVISPRNGYVYLDENDKPTMFLHIFKKKFDTTVYLDVYTPKLIYHLNSAKGQVSEPTQNLFGVVPVCIAKIQTKTIYDTIKTIQDAYERNSSDISNEISDFRNAYLAFVGCTVDSEVLKTMHDKGIIDIPTQGNANADVKWIIKEINDTFIQNTLTNLEDKMYQLASHINHNEKMQSNLSGVTLRSRLISLEDKCKLNEGSLADCITTRLQLLFLWAKINFGTNYDFRDIQTKFTPNIPQDVLNTAQVISTLGDKLSIETALSLLPFITNPAKEVEKINAELEKNPITKGGNILTNIDTSQSGGGDSGGTQQTN